MKKERDQSSANLLEQWMERDLSRAAADGDLAPAFELDEILAQINELVASGRNPVLVGEPGIGKTAIVHELARRVACGEGPPSLQGRRLVQISLRRRAAGMRQPHNQMSPAMNDFVQHLHEQHRDVVLFFRDIHVAYRYDIEPHLQSLGLQRPGGILCEGEPATVDSMFEMSPELEQYYTILRLEEPSLEKVRRLLTAWSAQQAEWHGKRFAPEALEEALDLAYRFLARSHFPRKVLDLLGQVAGLKAAGHTITQADVIERFRSQHRVPRALIDPAERLDLAAVEAQFMSRVLGQQEAVRAVVRMIGLIKSGLSDARRPFGVFFFVGPTGVGKTHLAQLLAEYLFGSRERMIRFNMSDHQEEHQAYTLFGNPDGTNPSERRGILTQRLTGHPFAVLLLDEFEKTNSKVHDRFMQLMDEGCFINGAGEVVSCRSMIIIATSNAGAEVFRGQAFGFVGPADADKDTELDRRLEKAFRLEFLNRFDQIVHFHPLSREDIRTIALRELEQLRDRAGLKRRKLALEIDESVLDWVTAHGYDPEYGARFLRRTIERHVATTLADVIVRASPPEGSHIVLTVRQNQIIARLVEDKPAATTAGREAVELPLGRTTQIRNLNQPGLSTEASRLLELAAKRLADLQIRREERAKLLEQMNEPGFWDRAEDRRGVVERFRLVDVAIQVEGRLAEPLLRLAELKEASGDAAARDASRMRELARSVERAAAALAEWQERSAEENSGPVWLVLSNADPLRPAAPWLMELTAMELAWCKKLRLPATVVAYEVVEEQLTRVALEVEGPGASAYLAMEEGMHRRMRHPDPQWRARLYVVPKSAAPAGTWPRLRAVRMRPTLFDIEPDCRARLELPERGLSMEFCGRGAATVSNLLYDLQRAWRTAPRDESPVARVYGEDGVGARDPRTGVTIPRMRDVMQGRLDKFLEAWRRRG